MELKDLHGTQMKRNTVMLTLHSISSTLNQVVLPATVWTYQLIQKQLTTLILV